MKLFHSFLLLIFPCLLFAQPQFQDTLSADSVVNGVNYFSTHLVWDDDLNWSFYLGEIPKMSLSRLRIYVTNPTDDTLYIVSFKTSAGCNCPSQELSYFVPHQKQWIEIADKCSYGGPCIKLGTLILSRNKKEELQKRRVIHYGYNAK